MVPAPHFLLFSESRSARVGGQWRFVLQSVDSQEQLEATDDEVEFQGERLELLAVVRGLEALDGPSRVTLVTPSRYVSRGLRYGLDEWRSNGWQWEHFGEMAPVKNRDLWQRIDRALQFHDVECRPWRFDLPHGAADLPALVEKSTVAIERDSPPTRRRRRSITRWFRYRWLVCLRLACQWAGRCRYLVAPLGTRFVPLPRLE